MKHACLVAVLVAGCLPPVTEIKTGSTMAAADLPSDAASLVKFADDSYAKQTPSAVANALVALEKAAAAAGKDVEVQWRAARAAVWLAEDVGDQPVRAKWAERGIEFATLAIGLDQRRVEGHYYLAIAIGFLATTKKTGGTELVPKMYKAAQDALASDERYDSGGPLRLIGAVLAKVPVWPVSVGDPDEAVKYLRRAVLLFPLHPHNHLLYADALVADDKLADAEREYRYVLVIPPRSEWAHRLEGWRKEAEQGLRRIETKRRGKGTGDPF